MAVAAGAIISKVRSMYGAHLNEQDYAELLRKRSVPEIAAYLKQETHFAPALQDVRENNVHRGQLENVLRKYLFRQLVRLYRYADTRDSAYYHLFIEEVEIDIILQTLRMLISGRIQDVIADLPVFMREYFSYPLLKIGNVRCFDDLLDVLEKTYYYKTLLPYRVVKGKEGQIAYAECEAALLRAYNDRLITLINKNMKGSTRKELLQLHTMDIELNNLAKIYRFKHYYNVNDNVITESMIPIEGSIRKRKMQEMIAAIDDKAYLKLLSQTPYHLQFQGEANIDIERSMNQIRYKDARKKLYYSQKAPVVFAAYAALLQSTFLRNVFL